MKQRSINQSTSNPVIFWIEVWSSKGVQKVLNKISQSSENSFEEKIEAMRYLLTYPGIWDEGNISTFIDVFYGVIKKYHGDRDNRITMQQVWKRFEGVRSEQLMEKITLSTEDTIVGILSWIWIYYRGDAHGYGWVGAFSIRK